MILLQKKSTNFSSDELEALLGAVERHKLQLYGKFGEKKGKPVTIFLTYIYIGMFYYIFNTFAQDKKIKSNSPSYSYTEVREAGHNFKLKDSVLAVLIMNILLPTCSLDSLPQCLGFCLKIMSLAFPLKSSWRLIGHTQGQRYCILIIVLCLFRPH